MSHTLLVLALITSCLPQIANTNCPVVHEIQIQHDGSRSCKQATAEFEWAYKFGVEHGLWQDDHAWAGYTLQFIQGVTKNKVFELPFLCGKFEAIGCTKLDTRQMAVTTGFENKYQTRAILVHELLHTVHTESNGHCNWAEAFESTWRDLGKLAPFVFIYDSCAKKECYFFQGEKSCLPVP